MRKSLSAQVIKRTSSVKVSTKEKRSGSKAEGCAHEYVTSKSMSATPDCYPDDRSAVHQTIQESQSAVHEGGDRPFIDEEDDESKGDPIPCDIFNNYFSIGVDASIAMKFHVEREKHPEKFNSRVKNKMWYLEFATSETFFATCKNIQTDLEISVDGIELDLKSGPSLQGIALLNIPSIYGGSNLWGENLSKRHKNKLLKRMQKREREYSNSNNSGTFYNHDLSDTVQSIGDKLIEVVGLESCMHVGQVKAGLRASGRRLAQGTNILIKSRRRFPMQIDGEPWMQPPCTVCFYLRIFWIFLENILEIL